MNQPEQYSIQPTNNKEPWLAVNLSKLWPGIGQIYVGKTVKGYGILLGYFSLTASGLALLLNPGSLPFGIAVLIMGLVILPIWNLFDAYYSAKKHNSSEFESERRQNKDPWLAVFLSSFIPGLGHAYLRKWLWAFLLLFLFIGTILGTGAQNLIIVLFAYLVQGILSLFVLYNVYISAPVRRERSRRTIVLLIAGLIGVPILVGSGLAIFIRQFIAEARYIPSGSMLPTLQIGDRLIVDKLTYRYSSPKRGDIVVFSPTAPLLEQKFKDPFIFRIIGIPGDRVEVKNGQVYINGNTIQETYIDEPAKYYWNSKELIPDGVVPADRYIVLGDNRNNSYDSHYWGFVPRQNIIGRATNRFYPLDRVGSIAEE